MPRIILFESCSRFMADEKHRTSRRDPLFDVVKLFAILLVVVGHVFNKGYDAGTPEWFSNFRDEMTMPLFFIVSGYFASPTILNRNWHKLLSHIRSYLQPLFVISLIFTPFYYMFQLSIGGNVPTVTEVMLYPVKRVLFAGWFVWILSFSYLIAYVLYRPIAMCEGFPKTVVALAAAGGLYFIPEFPRGACQLHYLPLVFPFFVIGIFWHGVSRRNLFGSKISLFIGLAGFLIYLIVVSLGPAEKYGLSMYSGQVYGMEWLTSLEAIVKTLSRIAVGIIGSFSIVAIARHLIPVRVIHNFAQYGMTTLGVYLLHQWLLDRIIDLKILPGGGMRCTFVAVALFMLCHIAVAFSKKQHALAKYLWGTSKV